MLLQLASLVGTDGCLRQLRFSPHIDITEAIASIYQLALTPKAALPSLQMVYQFALGELQSALNSMAEWCGMPSPLIGIDMLPVFAPFTDATYAEWVYIYLLSSFSCLASSKNSLIAVSSAILYSIYVL